jgi:hypothetical protein
MNKEKQTIINSKISHGMKRILKTIPYIIIAVLFGVTVVYAAPGISKLTPSGDGVTDAMYSLSDIYSLATDGIPAREKTGDIIQTPDTLRNTGVTLTQVYDKVAILLNRANGISNLTWQTDPAINLCWSNNAYEISNGCTVGSGFVQTPDTLTTLGAVEYCKYLNADGTTLANSQQNIWHLPTIGEYQSITDFTIFNNATQVSGFAPGSDYWSGTKSAGSADDAWVWGAYYGYINYDGKNSQYPVRCAH